MFDMVTSAAAAATSISFTFYGFEAKSAHQQGNRAPPFKATRAAVNGMKAAPAIAVIISAQMTLQGLTEDAIPFEGMSAAALSGVIVGGGTSPLLAGFNGLTMGHDFFASMRVSVKEGAAIAAREASFIGALAIATPITKQMKEAFGDNAGVEVASNFTVGVIGSLFGHIGDTALTRWQAGMQINFARDLTRGVATRALTIGCFTAIYQTVKKGLQVLQDD